MTRSITSLDIANAVSANRAAIAASKDQSVMLGSIITANDLVLAQFPDGGYRIIKGEAALAAVASGTSASTMKWTAVPARDADEAEAFYRVFGDGRVLQ